MYIIAAPLKVGFIPNCMFPKSTLPYVAFLVAITYPQQYIAHQNTIPLRTTH
jgi:hypothetical protein